MGWSEQSGDRARSRREAARLQIDLDGSWMVKLDHHGRRRRVDREASVSRPPDDVQDAT